MLTWIEWIVYVCAIVLLILHFKLAKYNTKKILMHTLVIAPFIYFSVNMLTEAVTADEPQYIFAFINPRNIKNQNVLAMKVLYEYKFSQMLPGVFFIFNTVKKLGIISSVILYRIVHYFLVFLISLLIARIWREQIFKNREGIKLRISESILIIVLVGMPLSCLFLKICNYDPGSTYPALLGFSMLWGAYKKKSIKEGFAATLVTSLGVLDKWTALPYWCISVVLLTHLFIENERGIKRYLMSILAVVISYASVIGISLLNLIYLKICQDGLYAPINVGNVTFSFTHAARVILSGNMNVDYFDVNAYNNDAFKYVVIVIFMILGCLFLMEGILKTLDLYCVNKSDFVNKVCAVILPIFVVGGVIAAYFIPLKISPYLEIQEGYYLSRDNFDGWIYHYGAKTAMGHFVCKICYMCAIVICSYPTVATFLVVVAGFYIIRKRIEDDNSNLFAGLFWICSILLLILYAIAGMPSDAKYFSFSIYAPIMCTIYYMNQFYSGRKMINSLMATGYVLFIIEMVLYSPNIKSFSPMWVVHSKEHNQQIRTGEWYAGESMLWGEDLAIGGNKIKRIIDKSSSDVDYSQICIYSDYGTVWLKNWVNKPGFTVKSIYNDIDEVQLNETNYFIFNRFSLFRGEIPDFIYEVTPIDIIEFKGDIGAWIYRGDQLREYENYFERVAQ